MKSKDVTPLQIDISIGADGWPDPEVVLPMLQKAAAASAVEGSLDWPVGAELSVLLTSDEEMTWINGQWRDKPRPTNVLSFPGSDVLPGEAAGAMIGDLVFALETVKREADEQQKTFEDHFIHLAVHGFLHLFGYDHQNDDEARTMEQLEIRILKRLGITDPYA